MARAAQALGSRYRLLEVIGTGAMGEVWVAEDQESGTRLAAKVLRSEFSADPTIVGRFIQERSILLSLDHPKIVRVRDLVIEGDQLALIMDLVEGSDARSLLRREGTLQPALAVRLTADVLEALDAAHALNILHRDVKPDNVLLSDQSPRPVAMLTDFSIACLAQSTTVRMTGVLGTAEYIAPEVFLSQEAGRAVDVYGSGILLYELLAGRTPFAGGGNEYAVAHRHVSAPPPPIDGLPPTLASVLDEMLAKQPDARPTANAAAAALRRLEPELQGLERLPVSASPEQWDMPSDSVLDPEVKGYTSSPGADPKATNLRGIPSQSESRHGPASGGPAGQISPLEDGPDTDGRATAHVAVQRERARPFDVLDPLEKHLATSRKPSKRVLIAGVVAAVVVIALVVVLVGGHRKAPGHTASKGSTVAQSPVPPSVQPLSIGGQVTRTATFSQGQASVQVTYQAPSSVGLGGDFLEAFPAISGSCPQVNWTGGVGTSYPAVQCGYEVQTGAIAAGQQAQATATFIYSIPSHQSTNQALTNLQNGELNATKAGLNSINTGSQFADERLAGLSVVVDSPNSLNQPLPVQVAPIWGNADNQPDPTITLYDDTGSNFSPFNATLIKQITGGSKFTLEMGSGDGLCYGAVHPEPSGILEVTSLGDSSCELDASIGGVSGQGNVDLSDISSS